MRRVAGPLSVSCASSTEASSSMSARVLRETPSPIGRHLDSPAGRVASDQSRYLRSAQIVHLHDVAPQQAPRNLALLSLLLPYQHPLHPAITLLAIFGFKTDFLAGRDKQANRFQTQLLCVVHADVHYPA